MSVQLPNVTVGRWCGGIHVTPLEVEGMHVLAGTPAYLSADDVLLLLVMCWGESVSEILDANVAQHALTQLHEISTPDDPHDRIVRFWDRQP